MSTVIGHASVATDNAPLGFRLGLWKLTKRMAHFTFMSCVRAVGATSVVIIVLMVVGFASEFYAASNVVKFSSLSDVGSGTAKSADLSADSSMEPTYVDADTNERPFREIEKLPVLDTTKVVSSKYWIVKRTGFGGLTYGIILPAGDGDTDERICVIIPAAYANYFDRALEGDTLVLPPHVREWSRFWLPTSNETASLSVGLSVSGFYSIFVFAN